MQGLLYYLDLNLNLKSFERRARTPLAVINRVQRWSSRRTRYWLPSWPPKHALGSSAHDTGGTCPPPSKPPLRNSCAALGDRLHRRDLCVLSAAPPRNGAVFPFPVRSSSRRWYCAGSSSQVLDQAGRSTPNRSSPDTQTESNCPGSAAFFAPASGTSRPSGCGRS